MSVKLYEVLIRDREPSPGEALERTVRQGFVKAMATYHLIEDDDRILVGLSGGKDSLLLTELLAKRAKIDHPRFSVEALHVRMENIHYETDTSYLQQFCDSLGIRLHVKTTRFEVFDENNAADNEIIKFKVQSSKFKRRQKQPCFLAQELGCNKIALGHHQDDIIHTALMNLCFQSRFSTMPALLKMRKMPLTIIRPLCLIPEADIKAYAKLQGYQKQQKLCPYETNSHRTDIKQIYDRLEQLNPEVRYSIWSALETNNKLIEEDT